MTAHRRDTHTRCSRPVVVALLLTQGLIASCSSKQDAPGTQREVPSKDHQTEAALDGGRSPGSNSEVYIPEDAGHASNTGSTPSNPALDGGADSVGDDCSPAAPITQKRVVRLTTRQLLASVEELISAELADQLASTHLTSKRTRLPLLAPDEGPVFSETTFARADAIADAAGKYVQDHFEAVTQCSSGAAFTCVDTYVQNLAERAYRAPLSVDEKASLTTLTAELLATAASFPEIARWGVHAVLTAPQFLYRRELGVDVTANEELSSGEFAQLMSFFITDAPPDDELRSAVATGAFEEPSAWRLQAARLLATERGRQNMTDALLAYFDFPRLNAGEVSGAPPELRQSMHGEVVRLINRTLRSGTVDELLTSKQSYLDPRLAEFYGVALDAATEVDAEGFALSPLPPGRSGLLSTAAFLTTDPTGVRHSVVRRGTLVRGLLQCKSAVPFPGLQELPNTAATERARAEQRLMTEECNSCHALLDPIGLVFDSFDGLGRLRTVDEGGAAVRSDATLSDGTYIESVEQLASYLTLDDAFAECLAQHWLQMGLAELPETSVNACSVRDIVQAFSQTERSMSDLIQAVVASPALRQRTGGTAPQ